MADDTKDQGSEIAASVAAILGKHNNDAQAAINQLLTENFKLRDKNRDLREQLTEAEKGKPAEGSVVLSKADAERWKSYAELGKPEELKTALSERDALKTEVATAKREQTLRDVADAEGWNYAVVRRLAGDLQFEVKGGRDDKGNATREALIVTRNGERTETQSASEYAESEWKEFLPSLKVNGEAVEKPKGTQYVRQPGVNSQPATRDDLVKAERSRLAASGKYGL